jgi:hypothetical protein
LLESTYRGQERLLLVVPALECDRRMKQGKCANLEKKYNFMEPKEIKEHVIKEEFHPFGKSTLINTRD